MINVIAKHPKGYSKIEQLFPNLSPEAMTHIESLEADGYLIEVINLPSHIDTPQAYAANLLDLVADMYQDDKETFN